MEDNDEKTPHLPMDIMLKLPAHISDPATLARASSSYKLWRSIIKDPSFLAGLARRRGDHGFTPSLLLGFFYQDSTEAPSHLWQHQEDMTRCLAPSFIPTSELVPSRGRRGMGTNREEEGCNTVDPMSLATFFRDIGAHANFYQPVASQDSFLALCRRSQDEQGRDMPDVLRVCNPLSGEVFKIPDPFREVPPPQHYVLLVTSNDDDGRRSFRLVSIWIKGKKLIYRYYFSSTRAWWQPTSVPEVMPGHYLMSSPAAASHGGAIHWLCGSWKSMAPAYLCTLIVGQEELVYVDLPPDAKFNNKQAPPLLASSADGATLLLLVKGLQVSIWKHKNGLSDDDWVRLEKIDLTNFPLLPPRVQMMRHRAKLRPESFRGKSGTVVIWMEGEGLYLLSLGDRSLRKIDNENLAKYSFLCPYEIDWLSCLAITNLLVADGSTLHEGRNNIHGRWKTLGQSEPNNASP